MKKTYIYNHAARKPFTLYADIPNAPAGGWLLFLPSGPVCGATCSEDVADTVAGVIDAPLASWQPVDESDVADIAAALIVALCGSNK